MHGHTKKLTDEQNEICYGIKLSLMQLITDLDNEKVWDLLVKKTSEKVSKKLQEES